jgi:hypothetical protein
VQKSVNILQGSVSNLSPKDGTTLITQASVLASGGFPYHIGQPGSYRLGSDLVVPDANTTAIIVDIGGITIDLSGFAIRGPVSCNGGAVPCSATGTGLGIVNNDLNLTRNITVRNGTIEGMGAWGIVLSYGGNLVDQVHAHWNGVGGIAAHGVITRSTAIFNGTYGIDSGGGVVSHNWVLGFTGATGIVAGSTGATLITANAVDMRSGPGPSTGLDLTSGTGTGYSNNVIQATTPVVGSGTSLGGNLCGAVEC